MKVIEFLECACIVLVGFIIAHFINRKVAIYPRLKVYEMYKENPSHKGKTDAEGMVVIVTGSTSGIGQKISEELFGYGATVILASRNSTKGYIAMEEIKATYPGSKGKLVYGKLDTSDLDSVKEFATWVNINFNHIDYLVNNAGFQYGSLGDSAMTNMSISTTSKQGYDECFAANYLGHFLLTHLLLPTIRERVINIASSLHFQPDGTTLNPKLGTDNHTPIAATNNNKDFKHRAQAYGVSKLANVFHAIELQKRLPDYGYPNLKVISVSPGWVQTNIFGSGSKGIVPYLIHSNAFKLQEGILSSMNALFNQNLHGGEFVSNAIFPLSTYSWYDNLLQTLSKAGVRDQVMLLLGLVSLVVQSQSYGMHTHRPSPECTDTQLTADFYDWTLQELQQKGYIATI